MIITNLARGLGKLVRNAQNNLIIHVKNTESDFATSLQNLTHTYQESHTSFKTFYYLTPIIKSYFKRGQCHSFKVQVFFTYQLYLVPGFRDEYSNSMCKQQGLNMYLNVLSFSLVCLLVCFRQQVRDQGILFKYIKLFYILILDSGILDNQRGKVCGFMLFFQFYSKVCISKFNLAPNFHQLYRFKGPSIYDIV